MSLSLLAMHHYCGDDYSPVAELVEMKPFMNASHLLRSLCYLVSGF